MYRIVLVVVFLSGAFYLYSRHGSKGSGRPLPEPPPKPPVLASAPPMVLTEMEIEKIRLATIDGDPQVRWAAIDLLFRVRDPQVYEILRKTLKIDSEPDVRRKSLDILKEVNSPDRVPLLISALNDTERNIRIAALVALGDIADPRATAAIVKALRDTDPIVRRQALNTLGAIQTKRDLQHSETQEKIRREYQQALEEHNRRTKGLTAPLTTRHEDLLEKNKVE